MVRLPRFHNLRKIKDGVVAATTVRMFRGCSRLISVDLSGLDTSKVTEMGREDTWESGMFSGCTRLAYLDVSSLDTSNVTSMGCMFEGCAALTSLDLSGFDTSNVTCMDGTFDFGVDKPVSFEQMITILARITATPRRDRGVERRPVRLRRRRYGEQLVAQSPRMGA